MRGYSSNSLTFSATNARDYPFPSVRISCAKCGRQGHYTRDRFFESVRADAELSDALERISAACRRRQLAAAYDQCMALHPDLLAEAAEQVRTEMKKAPPLGRWAGGAFSDGSWEIQ